MSGFINDHFGPPFGEGFRRPSVFVHGLFLNLVVRYREVSGDRQFDPLTHRVAGALAKEFRESAQGILPTYRSMVWPTDNLPAVSALVRYDHIFHSSLSTVSVDYLHSMRTHYLDDHGMLASYVDLNGHRVLQGARGVGMCYALHFLCDVDPAFADEQYRLAKQHFYRSIAGVAALREFPEGVEPQTDIDSGRVLFGLGTAASGFGIGASAVMEDWEMTRRLLRASMLAGRPIWSDGELQYAAMPPVGQAVILFGKTMILNRSQPAKPE